VRYLALTPSSFIVHTLVMIQSESDRCFSASNGGVLLLSSRKSYVFTTDRLANLDLPEARLLGCDPVRPSDVSSPALPSQTLSGVDRMAWTLLRRGNDMAR